MLSKEVTSTTFWAFGMTRPEIEPRFPEPLENTLPLSQWTINEGEMLSNSGTYAIWVRTEPDSSKATKNISCTKGESVVDLINNQRVEEILFGLQDPRRSKKIDVFEAVLQAIEANLVGSIWRVSGELDIFQSSVVHHLHDLVKNYLELPNGASCNQNISKLLTRPVILSRK